MSEYYGKPIVRRIREAQSRMERCLLDVSGVIYLSYKDMKILLKELSQLSAWEVTEIREFEDMRVQLVDIRTDHSIMDTQLGARSYIQAERGAIFLL